MLDSGAAVRAQGFNTSGNAQMPFRSRRLLSSGEVKAPARRCARTNGGGSRTFQKLFEPSPGSCASVVGGKNVCPSTVNRLWSVNMPAAMETILPPNSAYIPALALNKSSSTRFVAFKKTALRDHCALKRSSAAVNRSEIATVPMSRKRIILSIQHSWPWKLQSRYQTVFVLTGLLYFTDTSKSQDTTHPQFPGF